MYLWNSDFMRVCGSRPEIPTTHGPRSEPNRPPMIPAPQSPQTPAPTRVAGRCGMAGGRKRPPVFILHCFRPLGSPVQSGGFVLRNLFPSPATKPRHGVQRAGMGCGRHPALGKPTQGRTGGSLGRYASTMCQPFSLHSPFLLYGGFVILLVYSYCSVTGGGGSS